MPDHDPALAQRYRQMRIRIFAVTWLAYFGFYLTRKAFSVAKIGIQEDPDTTIDIADMAWIDGGYLVAYAVGQFFWGVLGDRWGARQAVLAGMAVSVLAAIAMGASTTTQMLGIFFVVQGLCQSSGWAPLNKNMCNWFSRRERGRVMGFWCTNYAVGGAVASIYAAMWAQSMGSWRWAFFAPALTLLLIWLLFYIFQREQPEDVDLPSIESFHHEPQDVLVLEDEPVPAAAGWNVIKATLTNPVVLILGLAYFLIKPTRYAILFWGPFYVNSRLHGGMTESAWVSGGFEIAGVCSVLLGGLISDKVFGSKRMPVCVLSMAGLAVFLCFFHHLPSNRWLLLMGYMLIGLLLYAPDSLISGAASQDFGTRAGASTAAGFVNGCGSIGAVLGGVIPGFMSEPGNAAGTQWGLMFNILAGMSLLGAIVLLPFWNIVPKTQQDH